VVTASEKFNFMRRKWIFYSCLTIIVLIISSGFKPKDYQHLDWFYVAEEDELVYDVMTEEESRYQQIKIPYTGKTFAGFKQALAFKESRGKYHLVNSFGYMGKYQFGFETLKAVGVRDSISFMNNPELQEEAFKALLAINKWKLRNEIEQFEGKIVSGVEITESGLLAAAHLGGAGSVKKFLKSNGQNGFRDGFGTSLKSYIERFAGYDTSNIIPNQKAKVKMKS
jgi:hypothetical protein